MKIAPVLLAGLLSAGCYTTKIDVRPTERPTSATNSIVVERSRAELWAKGIPALASRFFVINNLDQTSGLVNLSYAGDPSRYILGPEFSYAVQNPGATNPDAPPPEASAEQAPLSRVTFRGSQAFVQYLVASGQLVAKVTRKARCEGRANVVLEELGPTRTRVTANVRYVFTVTRSWEPLGRWVPPPPESETISFDTGGSGAFDAHPEALYYASGALEAELLSAFQPGYAAAPSTPR